MTKMPDRIFRSQGGPREDKSNEYSVIGMKWVLLFTPNLFTAAGGNHYPQCATCRLGREVIVLHRTPKGQTAAKRVAILAAGAKGANTKRDCALRLKFLNTD